MRRRRAWELLAVFSLGCPFGFRVMKELLGGLGF